MLKTGLKTMLLTAVAMTAFASVASAGKITIAHDAIPNLQMDAMTMVFKAADPVMVKDVKPGDAIQFTADKVNGQLTTRKGRVSSRVIDFNR